MKTITNQDRDLIKQSVVGGLTLLEGGVLEKDILITSALNVLSEIKSDIVLTFCGGTCLSKAHKLIKRMSEDIDFKAAPPEGMSRGARDRALSALKNSIVSSLESAGFTVLNVKARNENNYIGS